MKELKDEISRLYAENAALQQGYDAARMEIDGLRDRVQELGAMLRENRSKRIVELEAQLEAIGAGGVEPLRRREPGERACGTAGAILHISATGRNGAVRLWAQQQLHATTESCGSKD